MKKPIDTAIIESLLRVYKKPDDESLLIPRPALFNELGVFSQPLPLGNDSYNASLVEQKTIFILEYHILLGESLAI